MRYFKGFDVSKLDDYKFQMYSRDYLDWDCEAIAPAKFLSEMQAMSSIVSRMRLVHTVIWLMFSAVLIEFAMLFLHRETALDKGTWDCIALLRRLITFVTTLIMIWVVAGNLASGQHDSLLAVSEADCTKDLITQEIVDTMQAYIAENLEKSPKMVSTVFLLGVNLCLMLGSLAYKATACEKAWQAEQSEKTS